MKTENEGLLRKLASAAVVFDEVKHELKLGWRSDDEREQASRAVRRIALVGLLPIVSLALALALGHEKWTDKVLGLGVYLFDVMGFGVLYFWVIFHGAGRLAHRFAYQTNISTIALAKLIAWVANLSLWGWVVVIVVRLLARS